MATDRRNSHRWAALRWSIVPLVVLVAGVLIRPGVADARDSDGTRLGAQEQELGTEQSDSLDPPDDASDWRYAEVASSKTVEFRLESESGDDALTLRLTEATGDEIKSVTTSGGAATIRQDLSPGVYYFEIKSPGAAEYTIALD